MGLIQSWRWYGPADPVKLSDVEQAGATAVVHALHHIPVGEVWPVDEIKKRKEWISFDKDLNRKRNLEWLVVESVNVHEEIKTGGHQRDLFINNYCETLRNLAQCGLHIVCYNFMPVLDWTRTELDYVYRDGSKALRFDWVALAAFDLHMLKRPHAENDYDHKIIAKAADYFATLSDAQRRLLQKNILAGVPGSLSVLSLEEFKRHLDRYRSMDADQLRENLVYFLRKVIPTAEKVGVRLCIHPDDPPYPIFGLPRVVSTEADLRHLTSAVDSESNGITFCTGSLGPREENDLPSMVTRLGHKFHFIHLRNIQREAGGDAFHESDHLDGSVDMFAVMKALIGEVRRRKAEGRTDFQIPFRPDHGHQMLDDLEKQIPFPGYSAIGRLRGLAELRGLQMGIERM